MSIEDRLEPCYTGAIYDVLRLKIRFPVFCRYFTPRDVVASWVPDALGQPICIGEADIRTGDYILGDRDGLVVIPAESIEEVVSRTEVVMRTENLVRRAILQGEDPQTAYLKYGKF